MRTLHWVTKIGSLKNSLRFYELVFGLRVLRHEEFESGCEATCNGPYGGAWSKTMVGLGNENSNFVFELTYNYGIDSYASGNDVQYFAIAMPEAVPRATALGYAVDYVQGMPIINGPDGFRYCRTLSCSNPPLSLVPSLGDSLPHRHVAGTRSSRPLPGAPSALSPSGCARPTWPHRKSIGALHCITTPPYFPWHDTWPSPLPRGRCGVLGMSDLPTPAGLDAGIAASVTVGWAADQVALQFIEVRACDGPHSVQPRMQPRTLATLRLGHKEILPRHAACSHARRPCMQPRTIATHSATK